MAYLSFLLASWLWTPLAEADDHGDAVYFCGRWLPRDLQSLSCMDERVLAPSGDVAAVDLAPLSELTALESLDFSSGYLEFIDTMVLSDVAPLAALPLRSLTLSHTTLQDIRPLGRVGTLTSLSLHASPVRDVSPLSELTALESLDLSCTPVADLRPLVGLGALESLNITQTAVADLSPLLELPSLARLGINQERHGDPVIAQLRERRPGLHVYEGTRY